MTYANIIVETHGAVGLIRLNRPHALNALSAALIEDLNVALQAFETDPAIGAIVLTGSEKAFAAGADIKEMQDKTFAEAFLGDFISRWENVSKTRKPVIAAVAGFALGGGCELAMMCDFILAADTAKFGQPEIKLGVMPGAGGTQRLTRFVGKSKAMEMILTGRMMDAAEAERSGLVSRVVPAASLIEEALKVAGAIAALSAPAVYAAKESVNRAYETTLAEGVRFERRIFHSLFATEDQKEGMRAFAEKRAADVQEPVSAGRRYAVAGAPLVGGFAGSRWSARSMSSVLSTPIASKFASSHSLASWRPRSRNCFRKGQDTSFLVAALKASSLPAPPMRWSRSSRYSSLFKHAGPDQARNEVGGPKLRQKARVEGDLIDPIGDLPGVRGTSSRSIGLIWTMIASRHCVS